MPDAPPPAPPAAGVPPAAPPPPDPAPTRGPSLLALARRPSARALAALVLVAVVLLVVVGLWRWVRSVVPPLTEERVQTTVVTTIQQEVPRAVFVTGALDLTLTSSMTSTRRFLPGLFDLEVGRSEIAVRVPGRVSYGVDASAIRAEDVRFVEVDGEPVVVVRMPAPRVQAVEPVLERVELQSESGGWVRPSRDDEREALRRALADVRPALRAQAEAHLGRSAQPSRNTAEALAALLAPPLQAAGLAEPRFRFVLPDGERLELGAGAAPVRILDAP